MHTLADDTLLRLSGYLASNFALHFPIQRWNDLERNIVSASIEFGYSDVEHFIRHILSHPLTGEYVEILTSYLTNNETYFWREPDTFHALEQNILPELIIAGQKEKRIRIWSAGCSTGEEPYSIAIALHRLIPELSEWDITILASDISLRNLQKAKTGIYREWSFRNSPKWLKEKYFIKKDNNKYEIISEINKMVKFEYLNLADNVYPSSINNTTGMDIIFCRNVLMYFTQDRIEQVVRRLHNSLVPGGFLVVSACELSVENFTAFDIINFPGINIYQNSSEKNMDPTFQFHLPLLQVNTVKETEPTTRQIERKIDKLHKDDLTLDKQILLIRDYANQGKLSEALLECEKAVASDKLAPSLHFLYAIILQESNMLTEAAASLKRAIYLDANFVLSYYALGNIYRHLGNVYNAKRCFENFLLVLKNYGEEETLPESEGLTAGRFREIIYTYIKSGVFDE
ncbi:MAG: CheR family methyltransferase [Ignavibacteriaceae bacterium]